MQASRAGGSAEAEHIALTVTPARPATPFVVTTVTEAAARRIASMKTARSMALFLVQHPVGQPRRPVREIERPSEVEAVEDGIEVREGRRLGEELEGDAVAGVIGVEQVACIGEEPPPVLGRPELVDAVVFLEPGPRFLGGEGGAVGRDADLAAAELARKMHHGGQARAGMDAPRIKQ